MHLADLQLLSVPYISNLARKFPFFLRRKSERKITFSQFEKALELVAAKKYPGDPDGVSKLRERISAGKGPVAVGTTVREEEI